LSLARLKTKLLVLGAGYTGSEAARLGRAAGRDVLACVRSPEREENLRAEGLQVLRIPELDGAVAAHVDASTHVVIAFPPDGQTDQRVAPALAAAAAITYVSTTGVYEGRTGVIDDHTPLPSAPGQRAVRYLTAEALYRAQGATVLRSPAIYGPDRGLHVRIREGRHKIPGDGSRYVSRIHVHDLARLLLAAERVRGETFVVGDLEPARQIDVVRFVCEAQGLPLPPFEALEGSPESLRADRRVDPSRALAMLGVELVFPSYRSAMAPSPT
jgi:nucleoside-diphosphate-sugar epimerase